jgi:hypothetical protein
VERDLELSGLGEEPEVEGDPDPAAVVDEVAEQPAKQQENEDDRHDLTRHTNDADITPKRWPGSGFGLSGRQSVAELGW